MSNLTEHGRRVVEKIATRHGVSTGAATTLLHALAAGQGTQAQFDHPELGGMGQWSQGGMIMVGDMFNQALKAKVDALCNDLSAILRQESVFAPAPRPASMQSQSQSSGGVSGTSLFVSGGAFGTDWWPEGLGAPSSVGSQNNLRYALFPGTRRLAIDIAGSVTVYDTLDHQISGFSQQQSGDQSLTFTSQHGLVRVAELPVVTEPAKDSKTPHEPAEEAPAPQEPPPVVQAKPSEAPAPSPAPATPAPESDEDIFRKIERLAELRQKEILTAQEFETKKAELLARL